MWKCGHVVIHHPDMKELRKIIWLQKTMNKNQDRDTRQPTRCLKKKVKRWVPADRRVRATWHISLERKDFIKLQDSLSRDLIETCIKGFIWLMHLIKSSIKDIMWLVGWVLWHINSCRLFKAKSCLYLCILHIYDLQTHFLVMIFKRARAHLFAHSIMVSSISI